MRPSSLLLAWLLSVGAHASLLEPGSHCVAYKVEKTMFWVSSSSVVGKNCDVTAEVLPDLDELYHVEVSIPISAFQSGDSTRDKDVAELLKISQSPNLTFHSAALTVPNWQALFAKEKFDLEGTLTIGTRSFPIKMQAHYLEGSESPEIDGVAKVNFRDFDMTPPKVAGGAIATSSPNFELHMHLLAGRILGADAIRLKPTAAAKPETEKEGPK